MTTPENNQTPPEASIYNSDVFKKMMADLAVTDQQFAKSMEENQARIARQRDAVMGKLPTSTPPAPPPLPENVQNIVNALLAQPRVIPAVERFLATTFTALNTAIDNVLGTNPPAQPPE